jgi:cysteine synthase
MNLRGDRIMKCETLKPYAEYGIVKTPVVCSERYARNKNLYIKLEHFNLNASIKSRTAYFIIKDLLEKGEVVNLVESSSGNLGMSLGYFSQQIGKNFLCLVDPTVPVSKLNAMEMKGVKYKVVQLGNFPDYRTARIHFAKLLDEKEDWIWTNQYDNLANYRAHFETTGPELFEQMDGKIDYLVCAVGTGGTICGTGDYLKKNIKDIKVVAVEPQGSTIFGGTPSKYVTAGSGLSYPSGIVKKYLNVIDYCVKADDACSICECLEFERTEDISVGITTGSVLYAGKHLSSMYPDKKIVCISPDGGEAYSDIINQYKGIKASDNFKLTDLKHI